MFPHVFRSFLGNRLRKQRFTVPSVGTSALVVAEAMPTEQARPPSRTAITALSNVKLG